MPHSDLSNTSFSCS